MAQGNVRVESKEMLEVIYIPYLTLGDGIDLP